MSILQPSSNVCYNLKLPNLPSNLKNLDEAKKRTLTLDCRTGAAVSISRSNIFAHGGLVLPLNLKHVSLVNVQQELIMYFAKEKGAGVSFKNLRDWVSSETFFLDLISRTWQRVPTSIKTSGSVDGLDNSSVPLATSRLFHSMCYTSTHLYIFGGLTVCPDSGYELIATNSLWRLDLKTLEWTLISEDPQVPRRFSHSMHVKNENNEQKDTKIVIVGGLSNLDEPLHVVNIYNITQNCWEFELEPLFKDNVVLNIAGKKTSMVYESNFSILVENNEADVPALIYYYPQLKDGENSTFDASSTTQMGSAQEVSASFENRYSPLVALPLLPNSKGIKLETDLSQNEYLLQNLFDLTHPTGEYYGNKIIIAGMYPNGREPQFQCYSYDIRSGKWARINLNCSHSGNTTASHRFWKSFVWKSHHQILLIGSNADDSYAPTVQKFDCILSLSLPTANIQKKAVEKLSHLNKSIVSSISFNFKDDDQIPNSTDMEQLPSFGKSNYSSSTTSQFESYIRYIAPTEMESLNSVFEPYAMVLGKDAMELFGSPLSDFEFISDEGDAIGIPSFLLRKRWGRYFDNILSKGYSNVCQDYEQTGIQSALIRFSPAQSPTGSHIYRNMSDVSLNELLENKVRHSSVSSGEKFHEETVYPKLSSSTSNIVTEDYPFSNVIGSNVIPEVSEPFNIKDSLSKEFVAGNSKGTSVDTASTSTGMVFRVPFQDQNKNNSLTAPESKYNNVRRASLNSLSTLELLKKEGRRLSHPKITSFSHEHHLQSRRGSGDQILRHTIHSRRTSLNNIRNPMSVNSRRASVASQGSIMSFVSSNSDRLENLSNYGKNSNEISNYGVINIPLPPQPIAPTNPLPPTPNAITRKNSIRNSNRISFSAPNSPLMNRINNTQDVKVTSINNLSTPLRLDPSADHGSTNNQSLHEHIINLRKYSSSAALDERRASFNSENKNENSRFGSYSTIASNGNVDVEPLLTPRALYLPWSTATLKAFAEYFYTGQVNPKWTLVPVVLNLFIMSKLYDVPLLYSLISEVLYTIVSRKEENLFLICHSLINYVKNEVRKEVGNNASLLKIQLQKNSTYLELLKTKESLDNIENGYFNLNMVSAVSYKLSVSTNASSDTEGIRRASSVTSHKSNTFLRDSYREGNNSNCSAGSTTIMNKNFQEKKSSLLRESDSNENIEFSVQEQLEQDKLRDLSGVEAVPSNETNLGEEELSYIDKLRKLSLAYPKESLDENSDIDFMNHLDSFSSSQSDLDDSDFELGIFSLYSMKKKLNKRFADDSVDPLTSILAGSGDSDGRIYSEGSNGRNSQGTNLESRMSKSSLNTNTSQALLTKMMSNSSVLKDGAGTTINGGSILNSNLVPSLETLISPNALPPIRYVIKSIYRTAILTNDVKLMIRCLDCLEISKKLKKIKKKLNKSYRNSSAVNNTSLSNMTGHDNSSGSKSSTGDSSTPGQGSMSNVSWMHKNVFSIGNHSSSISTTNSVESMANMKSESLGPKMRGSKPLSKSISPRASNINFMMSPGVAISQPPSDPAVTDKTKLKGISPRSSIAPDLITSTINNENTPSEPKNDNPTSHSLGKHIKQSFTNNVTNSNQNLSHTVSNTSSTGSLFFFNKKK